MSRKLNLIFCITFIGLLLIPVLLFDFTPNKRSEIDNEYLPELDITELDSNAIDEYINKRAGLRVESLTMYQVINDRLFGVMVHPTYTYGKDWWVWFRNHTSLSAFQHMNSNEEYAEAFASGVWKMQQAAEERDMQFIFFLIPDKETVYPEYYIEGVNVKNAPSLSEQCIAAVQEKGVSLYYSLDQMKEAKAYELVNNRQYDAGHWNENGAFVSLRGLYDRIGEQQDDFIGLALSDYSVGIEHVSTLPVSYFPIDEDTPVYDLLTDTSCRDEKLLDEMEHYEPNDSFERYYNPEAKNDLKLIVIGDSYTNGKEKFFTPYFKEYIYIHRNNIKDNFDWYLEYLDYFDADIVVYEMPERSLASAGTF